MWLDEEAIGCLATVIIIVLAVAGVYGEAYYTCKNKLSCTITTRQKFSTAYPLITNIVRLYTFLTIICIYFYIIFKNTTQPDFFVVCLIE